MENNNRIIHFNDNLREFFMKLGFDEMDTNTEILKVLDGCRKLYNVVTMDLLLNYLTTLDVKNYADVLEEYKDTEFIEYSVFRYHVTMGEYNNYNTFTQYREYDIIKHHEDYEVLNNILNTSSILDVDVLDRNYVITKTEDGFTTELMNSGDECFATMKTNSMNIYDFVEFIKQHKYGYNSLDGSSVNIYDSRYEDSIEDLHIGYTHWSFIRRGSDSNE